MIFTRRGWAAAAAVSVSLSLRGAGVEEVVKVRPEVAVAGVQRFGLNLGYRSSWGAEQLISNVIMNPGFEGVVDRCLVTFAPLDETRFLEQNRYLGRPDRFWAGATFQVRTGAAAGYAGRIVDSRQKDLRGLPAFTTAAPLPAGMAAGDRIALTKTTDDQLPTQWWIPLPGGVAISRETRPASRGVRSLELHGQAGGPVEVHSYMDAIGDRAGKLLPIEGKWRLSFWARARADGGVSVRFGRTGAPAWLDRAVALQASWQMVTLDFEGGEKGASGTLDLKFSATTDVLLDDVDLHRTDLQQDAFRREVVQALETLQPGYLRDWQGQLGDTLENRLAPPGGRRAWRYRPGGNEATDFGYSLPEFLDLCKRVKASPWIVAPTTLSDSEWAALGRYLESRSGSDRFAEILVEFGNENWNDMFSAAGILDPARHSAAAARGFRLLREAAPGLPIRPVVNAQYVNPQAVAALAAQATFDPLVAVAPYFFRELNARDKQAGLFPALFAHDDGMQNLVRQLRGTGRELASYEINLHTTEGDMPAPERNPAVAGAASATALAIHLLEGLAQGVRRQCVYVLAGFDYGLANSLGQARLWGIARDLGATRRLRPTGLALQLLNRAAAGDLHHADCTRSDLTVAPFRSVAGWSAAVASSAPQERQVRIDFPPDQGARLPVRCLTVKAPDPSATNEESELVAIVSEPAAVKGRSVTLRLPPYGLAVLLPEDSHER